jgi:hypothetical protein
MGSEIQRDVDEHVLLPADHSAAAGLFKQGPRIDVVAFSAAVSA